MTFGSLTEQFVYSSKDTFTFNAWYKISIEVVHRMLLHGFASY